MGQQESKARRARALDTGPAAQAAERPRSKRWKWGRRKGGSRSPLRRLVYWSLVLGLWALIVAVGTIAFVVSTLPPIQSPEVPKRPPAGGVLRPDGPPPATPSAVSGHDVAVSALPPHRP